MTPRTRTERNRAYRAGQLLLLASLVLPGVCQHLGPKLGPEHLEHAVLLLIVKEVGECPMWPHLVSFFVARTFRRCQPAEAFDTELEERLYCWLRAPLSCIVEPPRISGNVLGREWKGAIEFEMLGTWGDVTELARVPLVEVHKAAEDGKLCGVVVEVDLDVFHQPVGVLWLVRVRKGILVLASLLEPQAAHQLLTESHLATR